MKINFSNPCKEEIKQPFMHLYETDRSKARKNMTKLSPTYKDELGNTILHYAAMYHDEVLLQKYMSVVDVNSLNNNNETPLEVAIKSYINEGFTTYENPKKNFWLIVEESINPSYDLPELRYNHALFSSLIQAGAIVYKDTSIQKLMEVYASHRSKKDIHAKMHESYIAAFNALYHKETPSVLFSQIRTNEQLLALMPLFDMPVLKFDAKDAVGKTLLHYICEASYHVIDDPKDIVVQKEKWVSNKQVTNHMLVFGTTGSGKSQYMANMKIITTYFTTFHQMYDKVLQHPNMKEEYFYIPDNNGETPYDILNNFGINNNYFKARTNAFYLEQALPLDPNAKIQRRIKV